MAYEMPDNTVLKPALKVPLSLDERVLEQFLPRDRKTGRAVDDPEITPLVIATRLARDEATSLVALERAVVADASRTKEARAMSVAEAADKSAARVTQRLDDARAKIVATIEREEKMSAAPPPPITALDIAREGQIRQRLAAMSEKERGDVIADAFANRKTIILAALLHGEAFEVGLKDAQLAERRHKYREQFHPGVHARLTQLRKALDAYDRAGELFLGLVKQAKESPAARLAASNRQRAEEALAAHAQGAS